MSVVMIVSTLSLLLGGLMSTSFVHMRILRSESHHARAMGIAEAGVSTVFGLLAQDLSLADEAGAVAVSNFSGGTFEVYVTAPMADVLLVTSHGQFGEETAVAAATAGIESGGGEDASSTLVGPLGDVMLLAGGNMTLSGGILVGLGEFGAHCNGDMKLSGGPNISAGHLSACGSMTLSGNPQVHLQSGNGRLHGNDGTTLKGTINAGQITSSTEVKGAWGTTTHATNIAPSVSWPNWFSPLPPISEQTVAPVAPMSMPELNVAAFDALATENDWYYEGNQNISRSWLTQDILRRTGVNVHNNETVVAPAGGVMFVDGKVSIASDMRFEGMIIATDNITIAGAATFNNTTPYPAVVSVNGKIVIAGGATGPTLNGWVYAMNGSVTAGGGASGCGIVAAQNISVTGGHQIGDFEGTPFLSPGDDSGGGGSSGQAGLTLLSWTR